MTTTSDDQLLTALNQGEEWALDSLFRTHYAYLCKAVFRVIGDRNLAEDLVQEVFYDMWRKRASLRITQSIRAYLKRAAINRTLNYIRDQKMIVDDETALPYNLAGTYTGAVQKMEAAELKQHIEIAVGELPERCRMVFGLSRYEEMTNRQIAEKLEISIKTVENQMTKALRLLREKLSPYLTILLCWLITLLSVR